MLVKICGLTDEVAALAAVEAGADLLGFVFARSRRRLAPSRAREIIAAVREHPRAEGVGTVGVFVDEQANRVAEIAVYCGLDYVQLCGDEEAAYLRNLPLPAIIARPATADLTEKAIAAFLDAGAFLLLDAYSPGERGGTGRTGDWDLAAGLAARFPVILAGGLTPDNVAAAIATVRPCGVDVSSGVETEGQKDPAKIAAFVRWAKTAARHSTSLAGDYRASVPEGRPCRLEGSR
ncbi:MAG: phosphoribosylanthranilate isomerase [Chloroflexota bacterium]